MNLYSLRKLVVSLNDRVQVLKTSIENLKSKTDLAQKCEHNVAGAYLYPLLCTKCTEAFYEFCKLNNVSFYHYKELVDFEEQKLKKEAIKRKLEEEQKRIEEEQKILRDKKEAEYIKGIKKYGKDLYDYMTKSHLSNEELGLRYERYIGYLFEKIGYKVEYHGAINKKQDRGIDLIVHYNKAIMLIQCKRYGKDNVIRENTITQLVGTLSVYKNKYNKNFLVGAYLYTQNDNLDNNAKEALKYLKKDYQIEHVVEKYDPNYPMIKCNIGQKGDKIYHLPIDALYDKIKIEVNKGECYVHTETEAQKLGFRRTKI